MNTNTIKTRIDALKQSRENIVMQGAKAQQIVEDCRERLAQHNGGIAELERLLKEMEAPNAGAA